MKTVIALSMAGAASAASVTPVGKVVQLLTDLHGKVSNDLAAEKDDVAEYMNYCEDTSAQKKFTIKTASDNIERLSADIEEGSGKISAYTAQVDKDSADIAAKSADLSAAQNVRDEEHDTFSANQKELADTEDMLSRAQVVLKRELSFVQSGSKTKSEVVANMGKLVTGLSAVIEATYFDPKDTKVVKAFLEDPEDADLSLTQQPAQATTYNYESKSGSIFETLKDMKDKAHSQLSSLRKEEMNAKHNFQMLKQSLEDAITNVKAGVNTAQGQLATTRQEKAQAEAQLATENENKAADQAFKQKLETTCSAKQAAWVVREKTGNDELAAINKAKDILKSGVSGTAALLQTKSNVAVAAKDDKRDRLQTMLRQMGRKFDSFGLMQLANRAASDPFVKVRGLIEGMISKLQQQAQAEATKNSYCVEELAENKKKKSRKNANVDKFQTRLDEANAAVATLSGEISELSSEIAEIDSSNAKATQIRNKESADFKVMEKDHAAAIQAVQQAIEVLQNFYSGSSFVQQPELGSSKTDSGNSIISFLEVAESEFTQLLTQGRTEEAADAENYEELMQKNSVAKAKKKTSIKANTSEIKSLKVAVSNYSSDLKTENTELDAILSVLGNLKEQCANKAMSYAERKAAREAEVSGLREALGVLEGEGVAFVQTKAFLKRRV